MIRSIYEWCLCLKQKYNFAQGKHPLTESRNTNLESKLFFSLPSSLQVVGNTLNWHVWWLSLRFTLVKREEWVERNDIEGKLNDVIALWGIRSEFMDMGFIQFCSKPLSHRPLLSLVWALSHIKDLLCSHTCTQKKKKVEIQIYECAWGIRRRPIGFEISLIWVWFLTLPLPNWRW